MLKGISIIICCYNSASRIGDTLAHLSRLAITDIECEIILVNNASSDNTSELAAAIWSNFNNPFKFIIINEPMAGVANARITGINTAKFEFSIFCDDDNWLSEDYIQNVISLFNAHPEAGIISGVGLAEFEEANLKPFWFDDFSDGYAIGAKGNKEYFLDSVFGAGMAMRTQVIRDVIGTGKMLLDGRKQSTLSAGEDAEICLRVRLNGYKILYSPKLIYRHYLPSRRLSWAYLKKLHEGFAQIYVVVNLYEKALQAKNLNPLPTFYWFNKGLYYFGIYLKYWFKHYLIYSKSEGTSAEIRHITWGIIAKSYFKYNFTTCAIYRNILEYKNNNQQF